MGVRIHFRAPKIGSKKLESKILGGGLLFKGGGLHDGLVMAMTGDMTGGVTS